MITKKIMMIITLIMFLLGTTTISVITTGDDQEPSLDEGLAEWTFMVYLAADNNLEGAGVEDVNEMETVGSNDKLNYIVQFDRAEGYDESNDDWKGTKRYRIEKDSEPSTITSPVLEDMGEMNMGDPDNLIDFVLWAYENYPARRYFLDLWNHGGAFWGVCWDDGSEPHDFLSMEDLTYALSTIRKEIGHNLDIIGFDACLMAQLGVMYQIKDFADYSVASGFVEPGDGWPYELIFSALDKNPSMSAQDLGSEIVNDYIDSYTDNNDDPSDSPVVSLALFDLSKINDLAQSVNRLAMILASDNTQHNIQVKGARSISECYAYPDVPGPFKVSSYTLFDVMDLMEQLDKLVPLSQELNSALRIVKEKTQNAIIDVRTDSYHPRAYGLSIYLPNNIDVQYSEEFDTLDFAKEGFWDDYIGYFTDLTSNAQNTPPTITIDLKPGERIENNQQTFIVTGSAVDLNEKPSVFARLDDGAWVEALTNDEGDMVKWDFPIDLSKIQGTNHTVSVKGSNSKGGETAIITRDFMVLNPGASNKEPKSGLNWWILGLIVVLFIIVIAVVYNKKKK